MGSRTEGFSKDAYESGAVGIVVIGRNEGARLIACLKATIAPGRRVVYVDSGSTDASMKRARDLGAETIALDMVKPFTAARARNAGYRRLKDQGAAPEFVQFVDGDCELAEGWIRRAVRFLEARPNVAVVCGRRREKFPERTIFNRLVDREWAAPVGEALACGGDAMMRSEAFETVGGFRESLIAGEEPELCVRLRAAGWSIHRLDAEMTRHDIDMTSLGQWLKRARRAGHAFAEVSSIHRGKPERIWTAETRRALLWTGLGLAGLVGGAVIHPLLFLLLIAWPAQIARIALRDRPATRESWAWAALIMLQKPWEAVGALQYWLSRGKAPSRLIEYKSPAPREDAR